MKTVLYLKPYSNGEERVLPTAQAVQITGNIIAKNKVACSHGPQHSSLQVRFLPSAHYAFFFLLMKYSEHRIKMH